MFSCCRAVLLHSCWIAAICFGGCATASKEGPIYKLRLPEAQAPAAAVAVSVTDNRPEKERSYRRGAIQPAEYQDGIETLTLENFEPHVTELLKQSFSQRLSALSVPPVWADVEIRRFRTLIDRREILAAEYERQLMNDCVAGGGVGIGVGFGDPGMGGAITAVGNGLMAAAVTSQKLRVIEEHRSSWNHAMEGVVCELDLHVQLHWQDGRRESLEIKAKSHSLPPDEKHFSELIKGMKWNIAETVEQAVIQATDQIGRDGERILASSGTPQPEGAADHGAEQLPAIEPLDDAELNSPGTAPLNR